MEKGRVAGDLECLSGADPRLAGDELGDVPDQWAMKRYPLLILLILSIKAITCDEDWKNVPKC